MEKEPVKEIEKGQPERKEENQKPIKPVVSLVSAKDYRGQVRRTGWFWQLKNDFNNWRWGNEEVEALRRDAIFTER